MTAMTGNIPISSQFIPQVVGIPQDLPLGRQERAFPVKTFKVFGGLQIGLGVLLGILSSVGVILDITAWNKYDDCLANIYSGTTDHYNSGNFYDGSYWTCHRYNAVQALFTFDIICLICSGWNALRVTLRLVFYLINPDTLGLFYDKKNIKICIIYNIIYFVTGLLPMCMTKKREAKWMCLKTGFMVCSLIGATNVVPTMFGLGVLGSITRERYDYKTTVNLPVLMAVFSFAEAIVAIVSASFCCCYSTYGISNQQGVVISTQPGLLINSPPTQIPIENRYYCITDQINNRRNSSPYREEQCQLMNPTELKEQLVQAVYGTNPPTYND